MSQQQQLSKLINFDRVKNAVAAGQTTINSSEVDMANYEGVIFVVGFGAITAGAATSIKAQQDTVTGMAGAADLEGTAQTVADDKDNKLFIMDIYRPRERFVRCVVSRATQDSVVDFILAIPYGAKVQPVTQGSTVAGQECHVSPAEGTA